ncbi:MAG: HDIG domain-containing protein, partial [Nitriliruptoraceae bacterium]|nr:HDIG domain-containing protein [Nitriliruptoraceae bacterium]
MSWFRERRLPLLRITAAAIVVLLAPLMVALGTVADEAPVREGEPSPRDVFAEAEISFPDEEATDTARRTAAASVDAVEVFDRSAQGAIVADVRSVFSAARAVRAPVAIDPDDPDDDERVPANTVQRTELAQLEPDLPEDVVLALVALGDSELEVVERETVLIAQELARQRVSEDELEALLADTLPGELALRSFPSDAGPEVAVPLIERLMRPTVTVDPDATEAARERAAEAVPEVRHQWSAGEAIVREGEVVTPIAFQAIERADLGGGSLWRTWLRATLAMLVVVAVGGIYLARMQPIVWRTAKKLVLLAGLVTAYAGLVVGASVLVDATTYGWLFAVPAGALAMLVALLIHPVVGIATMLPASILVLLVRPTAGSVALFAAVVVLISVPLTTSIAKRADLRSATLRAGLSYPVLALATVLVFGPREEWLVVLGAGAVNGIVTALAVQGALPFLETLFRLPTVTALLDLADRNHPLLRELETKALGSYNHSVMVASLTERACRAVDADPLLGSVAGLYHDIGKVRQPHFFIENQQGIANPHDDLEPQVSALIIQNHVVDGVEMAQEHRLPPEVVACISSHHGTMLVSYFYEQAIQAAGGERDAVDESAYRYSGGKPRSKEAAILLLADCCEATTRAMTMNRGTLPREDIEATVERLLTDRIDDGQFDECNLTFRELRTARDTIVESLVGIYHPRIAYPPKSSAGDAAGAGDAATATGSPSAPGAGRPPA